LFADLARRIGVRYVRELDCALGRHADINPLYRPPKRYADHLALEFDVETTALLEIFIESRLQKLQGYLRQHDLALSELSIELLSRQAPITPIRIGLAVPTTDMAHVKVFLHEHLQRVNLTEPVTSVCIQVNRLLPARGVSLQLFKSLTSSGAHCDSKERLGFLLEHLQARLQQQAVQQLQTQADYRPEIAQGMTVPQVGVMQKNVSIPSLPRRPAWLLQEPQLLCANSQLPTEIKLIAGPERIEAGWWDQHTVARDYYVASRGNQCCWLFRQQGEQHGWYLHGLFG
jgi:protein ImuB